MSHGNTSDGTPTTAPPPAASKHEQLVTTLFDLGRQITSVLDFDELLRQIPKLIRRLISFDAFAVYLLEERRASCAWRMPSATRSRSTRSGSPRGRAGGRCRRKRTAARRQRRLGRPRYVEFVPGMQSELVVPLLHRSRPIGALNILSRNVHQFTERDMAIVSQFAAHVAVAVVNARLFERSRLDAEAFETLAEIGHEVASVLDIDELFTRIAQLAKRVIDYRTFGILLVNDDNELEMKLAVKCGEKVEVPRVALGEGLVGYAALHKEVVLAPDVSQDPRYINLVPDVRSSWRFRSCSRTAASVSSIWKAPSSTPSASATSRSSRCSRARRPSRSRTPGWPKRFDPRRSGSRRKCASRKGPGGAPARRPAETAEGGRSRGGVRVGTRAGRGFPRALAPDSSNLVVAVGDVSGKGVPAALYSAFAAELVRGRTFRRRYLPERSSPAGVLSSVNTILHQRQLEEYYCTLCYTIFDLKRRTITLANSGLPYPIRCSAEGCAQIELPGVPLGSFQGSMATKCRFGCRRATCSCSARTACSRR